MAGGAWLHNQVLLDMMRKVPMAVHQDCSWHVTAAVLSSTPLLQHHCMGCLVANNYCKQEQRQMWGFVRRHAWRRWHFPRLANSAVNSCGLIARQRPFRNLTTGTRLPAGLHHDNCPAASFAAAEMRKQRHVGEAHRSMQRLKQASRHASREDCAEHNACKERTSCSAQHSSSVLEG